MRRSSFATSVLSVVILLISGCASSPPITFNFTPTSALVFSTQSVHLNADDSAGSSDVVWTVGGTAGGSVDSTGLFTAPSVSQSTIISVTATSKHDPTKTGTCAITVVPSGQVSATNQPQVAQYTITPPSGVQAFIQFSSDTTYNLKTWTQPAPSTGSLSFFVAGMRASTEYHMRAVLLNSDGSQAFDVDHTFTTQALPADQLPSITASTSVGMTPQPGVELLDLYSLSTTLVPLAAYDLSGNLIWSYPYPTGLGTTLQGVHLLPNGHFLMNLSPVVLREVDLAGNTIRQMEGNNLAPLLVAAGINYHLIGFHHDVIALPNGHWIALINISVPCADIPNCSGLPDITGDVIVDLAPQSDGTFTLAWTWSTFDHLDINRALFGYPDWTHSNALVYSPDDGNLLLSIRHQSWVVKIDYENGNGNGDIIWKLGYQGDFTLVDGTDPTDWFSFQHAPAFVSSNTSGNFKLTLMDNGNSRVFPAGVTCGVGTAPPCAYSTQPILQIDENAKTATLLDLYKPGEYSFWGGNAEVLTNGNLEGNFNAGGTGRYSDIFEVTPDSTHQTVWRMSTTLQNAYRGFRLPSLYPGVQW